jgi:hypothetical protein
MAELYSANNVTNPSAEIGTVTGWIKDGAGTLQAVAGGTDGSYCFYLSPSSGLIRMRQEISGIVSTPELFLSVDYLPEYDQIDTNVNAKLTARINYSDGSYDEAVLPVRRDT